MAGRGGRDQRKGMEEKVNIEKENDDEGQKLWELWEDE